MCTSTWMIHVAETLMKPIEVVFPHQACAATLVAGVRHGPCYSVMANRYYVLSTSRDGDDTLETRVGHLMQVDRDGNSFSTTNTHFELDIKVVVENEPRPVRGSSGAVCTCAAMSCIPCVQVSAMPTKVRRIELGRIIRIDQFPAIIENDAGFDKIDMSTFSADRSGEADDFIRSAIIRPGAAAIDWVKPVLP